MYYFLRGVSNRVMAMRLGQMPVTAANNDTAAGTYSSQLTVLKPVRKIPVQSIQLIKPKNTRREMGAFINLLLMVMNGV